MAVRPLLSFSLALVALSATATHAQPAGETPAEVAGAGEPGGTSLLFVEALRPGEQALMFDSHAGRFVVIARGDRIGRSQVTTIQSDRVVLSPHGQSGRDVVLSPVSRQSLAGWSKGAASSTPAVLDPYAGEAASAPAAPGAVLDPYAGKAVSAPAAPGAVLDPYAGKAVSVPAAAPADVLDPYADRPPSPAHGPVAPTGAVIDPYAKPPAPASSGAPILLDPYRIKPAAKPAAKPAGQAPERIQLRRDDLDRALADFGALARQAQIEPAAGGGIRLLEVAGGSLFARVGLKKGDVVRRVAGHELSSVDAAAAAYADLLARSRATVELERAGHSLAIEIQLI